MRRIDARTVELTEPEQLVQEIFEIFLDQGHGLEDALILMRGSNVPEGLQSSTPLLDSVLTPEFSTWLVWG